ncbi:sugar ABC transporter substrate-binding protein [Corynebacterium glutamicum]|uniref:ABC transporter substrate-binding protein n=1 Tax=Corynebacterium glutamicum TaxID=1718 RepID=UPI00097AD760|nr:ABC transporter substrate-binding protein [Corynebacterium glutamicum]GAV96457.1 sugar ABC transporter substrate-binding protein [Corynebacterium glutamicum]
MKFSKIAATLAVSGLTAVSLAACSSGGGETTTNADGATVVTFWHSSSGAGGETLEALVDEFNQEHAGEIEVQASFQGSYEDAISKFIASVQTGDLPALIQASDVQTRYMKDSGLVMPAEELSARSGEYDFDSLIPAVSNYYTMDDTVYSMPAMVSQPAMYTNDDALTAAGVDPESLKTVEGLLDAAERIHDVTGKAGLTFHHSGWYMEQFGSALGQQWCSPENGVGAQPADSFNIDTPEMVDAWTRIGELYELGAIQNPGNDGSAATGAFVSGEAAIQLNSSGGYGNVASAAPTFDWSIRSLPRNTEEAGAVPGGNSLWAIEEGHSEDVQNATWEFMKFIGSDESQERIFIETGYLPTTEGAQAGLADLTPQQEGLIDQLSTTPVNTVTAGCHSGALNDARQSYQTAMSSIANNGDAQSAINDAQQGADAAIASYNDRAGN